MSDVSPATGIRRNTSATDPEGGLFRAVPEADAAEERQQVVDDSAAAMERLRLPFDVNPADAMEQQQAVPYDEDDYR